MKYLLLFVDDEKFTAELEAMAPAEREQAYARVGQWLADHADKISGGGKLQPPHTATTVRLSPSPAMWRTCRRRR
ncbi:hypothetical protein [Nocardia sp. NPDC127526]|uniref:hypothetical protein n=1 Tax=Nocardia sp. NPDC127526 TaxID=3345393 RepID=UPI00363D30ED